MGLWLFHFLLKRWLAPEDDDEDPEVDEVVDDLLWKVSSGMTVPAGLVLLISLGTENIITIIMVMIASIQLLYLFS